MAVYRFRVALDDFDDVYRDIDILSNQYFIDFHHCIQEAFQFDKKHAASFFVSDDYWRKGEEITLREEDLTPDEEDIKKNISKIHLMSKSRISRFVQQPHQRFLYVFDPKVRWEFMIELIKILDEEPGKKYPYVSKRAGTPPRQYKNTELIEGTNNFVPGTPLALKDNEINEDDIYKAIADENFEIPEPDDDDTLLNQIKKDSDYTIPEEDETLFTDDEDDFKDDFSDDSGSDEEY